MTNYYPFLLLFRFQSLRGYFSNEVKRLPLFCCRLIFINCLIFSLFLSFSRVVFLSSSPASHFAIIFCEGKFFRSFAFVFSLTFDSLTSRFRSCSIEHFITLSFSIQFLLIFSRLTIAGFYPYTFSMRAFLSFPFFFWVI